MKCFQIVVIWLFRIFTVLEVLLFALVLLAVKFGIAWQAGGLALFFLIVYAPHYVVIWALSLFLWSTDKFKRGNSDGIYS